MLTGTLQVSIDFIEPSYFFSDPQQDKQGVIYSTSLELALQLERLQVAHVPLVVEEVLLQPEPGLLLVLVVLGVLLPVLVAAVARGVPAVLPALHDLPAEPAEVGAAGGARAAHVVAAPVLLDGHLDGISILMTIFNVISSD